MVTRIPKRVCAGYMHKPGLVFFHSTTSGRCRRMEGFVAQVLQRRRNHETFRYYKVAGEKRPDLVEKFGIAVWSQTAT